MIPVVCLMVRRVDYILILCSYIVRILSFFSQNA